MTERTLTTVEFRVDGTVIESVQSVSPPIIGETIEVGAKFKDGERLDSGVAEWHEWEAGDYETVLRATVDDVTRHYHTAYHRSELTVYVDVTPVEVDND